jgi:hypothetical protein
MILSLMGNVDRVGSLAYFFSFPLLTSSEAFILASSYTSQSSVASSQSHLLGPAGDRRRRLGGSGDRVSLVFLPFMIRCWNLKLTRLGWEGNHSSCPSPFDIS